MKAIAIPRFGDAKTLDMMSLPRPEPGPGELLVRVRACGLNPVDAKIRQGLLPLEPEFPLILGYDISGVVEACGEGVTAFKSGDEVFYMGELHRQGAYAEFHAVKEEIVTFKPDGLSHVEAASVPLAGCTAWQALFDRARIAAGEAVLIQGGAGGVGSLAVQLANWAGCEVFATASSHNHDFLEELGVDLLIDYDSQDVGKAVLDATHGEGAHVVFDTVGGEVFLKSFEALAPHGDLVTIVPQRQGSVGLEDLGSAFLKNATVHFHFVEPRRETLDGLARLLERGYLHPVVDEVVPFKTDRVAKAHRRLESGRGRGKMVIEVAQG